MYLPQRHDESATVVGYVEQQLDAIRSCCLGLTEEQARSRPLRSVLSPAGVVKHISFGMAVAIEQFDGAVAPSDGGLADGGFDAYQQSFALTDGETTVGVLEQFDRRRERYLPLLGLVDPDAETMYPPAPWHGVMQPTPVNARFLLWHQVEEIARHAGHVDLLREQLDGVSVATLVMTRAGFAANDFFTPYQPSPGTITT